MADYGDIRTGRRRFFVLVFVTKYRHQVFPDLAWHYWRANRLWSGSYFAGSVGGAPISVLRQYIEQQNRPA